MFATKAFKRDEFVCEYAGELISIKEAKQREEDYAKDEKIGSYMYYIQYNEKKYW